MFGILVSAFNVVLGFVLRTVVVKGLVFGLLLFVTTEFMSVVGSFLPPVTGVTNSLMGVSSAIWYFLDLFAFSTGLPMIISAYGTRFLIRRIPFIG